MPCETKTIQNSKGVPPAWFRQYASSNARWMTPDPAGLSAVDPTNPQSWNRYAYVLNNPLLLTDALGLTTCDANGNNCYDSVTVNGDTGRVSWSDGGGGDPRWVPSLNAPPLGGGGSSSGFHFQLFPSSLRLPGESFSACVDRAQKALLGNTGQTVLNAATGVSLFTAIPTTSPAFISSSGTTLAKAGTIAGETVNNLGAQISADIIQTTVVPKPSFVAGVINKSVASGTTLASDGAFFSTASGILSKASLITFAVGLGLEGGFAISCR